MSDSESLTVSWKDYVDQRFADNAKLYDEREHRFEDNEQMLVRRIGILEQDVTVLKEAAQSAQSLEIFKKWFIPLAITTGISMITILLTIAHLEFHLG